MAKELNKLTAAQKRKYLRRGECCPYCKSESITGESLDIEGKHASQKVSCQDCEREWLDIYRLADVEEIDS